MHCGNAGGGRQPARKRGRAAAPVTAQAAPAAAPVETAVPAAAEVGTSGRDAAGAEAAHDSEATETEDEGAANGRGRAAAKGKKAGGRGKLLVLRDRLGLRNMQLRRRTMQRIAPQFIWHCLCGCTPPSNAPTAMNIDVFSVAATTHRPCPHAGGRAAAASKAGAAGAAGGGAISASGHTCRGRVKQKGVKRAELLAVGKLVPRQGWFNAGACQRVWLLRVKGCGFGERFLLGADAVCMRGGAGRVAVCLWARSVLPAWPWTPRQ